jgi:preprotein translocase subunit SecA
MRHDVLREQIALHIPAESMEEQWDIEGLERFLLGEFQLSLPVTSWLAEDKKLDSERLAEKIILESDQIYSAKTQQVGLETMQQFERAILLQVIDKHWREHLSALDHLRQGIHLRSYGQKNPKQEYKREAFELFSGMLDQIKAEVSNIVVKVQINSETDVEDMQPDEPLDVQYQHANFEVVEAENELAALATEVPVATAAVTPTLRVGEKIARNDPCPCASGLKYKQCHGKLS